MSEQETNKGCGTSCGCVSENKYWQDVDNKVLDPKFLKQEFQETEFDSFSMNKSRRSFLKIMGFSAAALPMAGCIKIPVKNAIPYLHKNETVIPGVANWYATTFNGAPVLVKTREGRPIKVEGNEKSTVTMGAADAQMQASVTSLYDTYRFRAPSINGKNVEWTQFDTEFKAALTDAQTKGQVVLVTKSLNSPSELALINEFKKTYNARHVGFDAVSRFAFVKANELTFGVRTFSEYDFSKADFIVSMGVDFLGTWGNSLQNAKNYSKRRDSVQMLNKHIQIESYMSMTGSNADIRYTRGIAEQRKMLVALASLIAGEGTSDTSLSEANKTLVKELADTLLANKGRSLFLYGENDVDAQVLVNKINNALKNVGNTVLVFDRPYDFAADDSEFEAMIEDMGQGKVTAALFLDVNPVYAYYNSARLTSALEKVAVKASFASSADETSHLCSWIAPMNHAYESWSDTQVSHDEFSFTQPVVQALYGSRMATETLLAAMGRTETFHDYMKAFWQKNIFSKQSKITKFELFWNTCLHDGVVLLPGVSSLVTNMRSVAVNASKLLTSSEGFVLTGYQKVSMKDGAMANNPWLQEMPDPVTKATWENYVLMSPSQVKSMNMELGSLVTVTNGQGAIELPVIPQPGMSDNAIAIAVGYGRSVSGKVGKNVGMNIYPFMQFTNGSYQYTNLPVTVKATGAKRDVAQTQTHHSMEGRDIVRETTVSQFMQNAKAGNEKKAKLVHIYPEHDKSGHQWAMAIDLNKCTGCSACIVSCSAENNVPVVGKQEVINRREMHWIRLDRYYAGDENQPEVVHMPMTCQHCDNAPCENVCPVMATVQSSDGLNQQVYNRCVGTRYCANNCPYKVRRFNWFNYPHEDEGEKMALNPDVSVRSRGIMEKCSMCIQRIQDVKLTAKKEHRDLRDGDIKTACQQSCPSEAIVFGDKNDKNSKIAKYLAHERNYVVLEELNIQPRVSYLTKIRNK